MKNLIILTAIFNFLIVDNCFGQTQFGRDEKEVKNLILKSFDEIFSDRKKENIDKFYTDDFVLLEDGIVWNRDSIAINLDRMSSEIAEKKIVVRRVNKIDVIEVKIIENIAWLAYHNSAIYDNGEGKIYGEDKWLESAVAVRTKDGWKIQLLHSTPKKK